MSDGATRHAALDTPDATVAIVIVSYNVVGELENCLAALPAASHPLSTAVVVVDNGSSDGTLDMVRRRFPDAHVIALDENVGFARANNVGIRATATPYVLLLNPDTVPAPNAIATLVQQLASQPAAAAAGPRLVDAAGVAELSFGWTISPLGELRQKLVGSLYRRRLPGVRRAVERWTRTPGRRHWVSGACLLVRRADLEAVGLLDERYFMYTEDVDLCVSLRSRGKAILYLPDAEVVHLGGRSARRNPQTERLRRRSQLAYYEKHHPRWVPWLRLYLGITGKLP